jgi:hypothetical protein
MPPMAGLHDICAIRSTFKSEESGLQAHARGRHGSLASRVAGADYNHLEMFVKRSACAGVEAHNNGGNNAALIVTTS